MKLISARDRKKTILIKPTSFQISVRSHWQSHQPSASGRYARACEKKDTIQIQNKEDLLNRERNITQLRRREGPKVVSLRSRPTLTRLYTRTNLASGTRRRKHFECHLFVGKVISIYQSNSCAHVGEAQSTSLGAALRRSRERRWNQRWSCACVGLCKYPRGGCRSRCQG